MSILYFLSALALLLSALADRGKTLRALQIGWKKFSKLVPAFLVMLMLASLVLGFLPDKTIVRFLAGRGRFLGVLIAGVVGSVSAVPGFVAFPLAAVLLEKGVPYMVLAAFTTTLMMVGIVSFPLEKAYLGTRVALLRNLLGLATALAVSLAVGIVYGEILS